MSSLYWDFTTIFKLLIIFHFVQNTMLQVMLGNGDHQHWSPAPERLRCATIASSIVFPCYKIPGSPTPLPTILNRFPFQTAEFERSIFLTFFRYFNLFLSFSLPSNFSFYFSFTNIRSSISVLFCNVCFVVSESRVGEGGEILSFLYDSWNLVL